MATLPRMALEHLDLCQHIDAEAAAARRLLETDGAERLTLPVPSCPGWSVTDLVEHLGTVHRWAAGIVSARDRKPVAQPEPAYDEGGLAPWFADGAAALTAALRATEPADSCWTLARPHTVGFWSRRQAHETMVHRVDLADALGAAAPLDPVLAADGVDEAAVMFFPRQVRLGREQPLTDALALVDGTTGRRWLLAGDGTRPPDVPVDATVTAPAPDLLLLLWRRRSIDDTSAVVDGDAEAARRVLSAHLTP